MFYPKCYLCQEKNTRSFYRLNNRTIYRCLNDDLFFSSDKNDKTFNYDEEYFESSPYNQRQFFNDIYFQSKLNKIVEVTKEKIPNILDVGCGWGNFLQVVKKNQLPYLGVDLSTEAIEICLGKNLNCERVDLIELSKKSDKKYSAITFFQVIEHLKNPLDYLKAAKKLLKKNGIILLTTPNNQSPLRYIFEANWSVYQTPSHYFFYSKKSFQRLLGEAGFSNFNIKIDRLRFFSTEYVLQRIFKKKLSVPVIMNLPIPTDPWGDLEAIIFNH